MATSLISSVNITPHADRPGDYVLQTECWLPRGREEVFAFFADAYQLEAITPGWLKFKVLTPRPIAMQAGRLIDYRLRLHGLPIRWRTEISIWEPPLRFVDRQIRGPYARWEHEHTFVEQDVGTLVRDRVEYRPRGGAWLHRVLVRPDLERIFGFRGEAMRSMLAGDAAQISR